MLAFAAAGRTVCRIDSSHDLRRVRLWVLIWRCLAHIRLFANLVVLLGATRNPPWGNRLRFSLKGAVKLVSHHHVARAFWRSRAGGVGVMDEPDWHKLWSILFPAERLPEPARTQRVIKLLWPPGDRRDVNILVDIDVPVAVCIARVAGRTNPESRFNRGSMAGGAWADLLRQDRLYGEIRSAEQGLCAGDRLAVYLRFSPERPVSELVRHILALR